MKNFKYGIITSALLLCSGAVAAAATSNTGQPTPPEDYRQLVEMPGQAQQLMRQDMQDHLAALSEVLGYLASKDFTQAAEVAEKRMGKSSMGKHRETGMGPGRFMPLEMRQIGWAMHEAASDFAESARSGEQNRIYAALQKVMSSCTACHLSYRTR